MKQEREKILLAQIKFIRSKQRCRQSNICKQLVTDLYQYRNGKNKTSVVLAGVTIKIFNIKRSSLLKPNC